MKKPVPFKEDKLLHLYIFLAALPFWVLAISETILHFERNRLGM